MKIHYSLIKRKLKTCLQMKCKTIMSSLRAIKVIGRKEKKKTGKDVQIYFECF